MLRKKQKCYATLDFAPILWYYDTRKGGDDMFYSEVLRIIEAGLDKDKDKVKNYAVLLAKKLADDGDSKSSKRIETLLARKNNGSAVTDALVAPPVDQESRMGIVDIDYSPSQPEIVLSSAIKARLTDFEDTIRIKDKLDSMGMPFNMSLLLYGPPGCGKTSIAYYLANQFGLPLVTARLDTLISSLLGNTAKNLRRVFDYANRQPCVLFLDEFDAIAKARDDQHELGELKRVVNSLLQNMDTYCQHGVLIAATNHQELLDDAIWRRFQTVIEVPKPAINEIEFFFSKVTASLDKKSIADKHMVTIYGQLGGLSYSDIQVLGQNVVKQKLIQNEDSVSAIDFLTEIMLFKQHGNVEQSELIHYLLQCGIPQRSIAEHFKISVRQVRNCIELKGEEA